MIKRFISIALIAAVVLLGLNACKIKKNKCDTCPSFSKKRH
jgi:hypothetical protein